MVAHFAALSFTLYIMYVSKPGTSLFSWHPTLMSLAFCFLMVEAILVFNPESSLFLKSLRNKKVRIHWILQICAIVSALLGFLAIVWNKVRNEKDHFTTWHGTFGVMTVVYMVVQTSFGVLLLYPQVAQKWKWTFMQLKVYHATFGLLGFTLASITIVLALFSTFMVSTTDGFIWGLCFFCPAWCVLVIMKQVTKAYLPITRPRAYNPPRKKRKKT